MQHDPITLWLPIEFIEMCNADDVEPREVLRSFIADLCDLIATAEHPRSDGYASSSWHGRVLARQYYERVWWGLPPED